MDIFASHLRKSRRNLWDFTGRGTHISSCVYLWTCSSALPFQQIIEDSNCFSSEKRHFDHNLFGRYALNLKDSRECSDVSQYSDLATAGAEVCDKSKEVGDGPLIGDRVCGYGNNIHRDDYLYSRKKASKNGITMFRFV